MMSWRVRIDVSKDLDSFALRRNETVPNVLFVRVRADNFEPCRGDRLAKTAFHL